MSEIVLPAVIAAITSLLICIITVFQFFRQQRLLVEQFEKGQNRSLTSKLYDLRLEYYPKAFELTDRIHKIKVVISTQQ